MRNVVGRAKRVMVLDHGVHSTSSPSECRCAFCGHRCRGYVCRFHKDLPGLDWRGE